MEPNKRPNVRLRAGGYAVSRSRGPAKRQKRRSISPMQSTRVARPSANGRMGVRR